MINNLQGTTWYIPRGWAAIHNYGTFSVNYNYEYGDNSGSQSTLRIGFDNGSSDNGDNIIGFGTQSIYSTAAFTLTFTGGTDVTNPKLIAWLSQYGELQVQEEDEEETPEEPTESTPTFNFSTLNLPVGTYTASALANAVSAIASALSNEVQYEVVDTALYAPEISATENDGQILISDTVNGNHVVSYNVYTANNNGYVTNVARTGTQTSVYIDHGVSAYVKAVDSSGNESAASNIIETHICFVAGTPVLMADGTYKMIEEIEAGDKVRSYDISTGEYTEGIVTEVVYGYTDRLAMVLFSDSNYLVMAEGHPLYTLDGWHSITNKDGYPTLVIGDKVLGAYGYVEIIDLQVIDVEPTMVYSLAVSKTDGGGGMYFVGAGISATHSGGAS